MSDFSSDVITCPVCMHHCKLKTNQTGLCHARKNTGKKIESINYGKVTSLALDPIEKKPLYHFNPKSMILSVGSFGCNLLCPFCQNHGISQVGEDSDFDYISPEDLLNISLDCRQKYNNIGVAFTYNEALVGYEYVRDSAKLIKENGMHTVLVTNGSASQEVLSEILPYIDAMNVDLKAFTEEGYRKLNGDLNTVKNWIKGSYRDSHVEITSLIVPGINDSETEMEEMAKWIASLDNEMVLHITRYFPRYKHTAGAPTSINLLYRLRDIAEKHLKNVYVGNV